MAAYRRFYDVLGTRVPAPAASMEALLASTGSRYLTRGLASLREIIIGPTEGKLRTLETRVNDRFAQARDISALLPQALLQRADETLSQARLAGYNRMVVALPTA